MTRAPAPAVIPVVRIAALLAALSLLPLLLGAQAVAPDSTARPVMVATPEGSSPTTALRPGDVLRLKIWLEPDLSGDFTVDESGQVTLPRLGVTSVAGLSSDQLREQLVIRYREFLNNPSIEIIPLRRISILGAVQKPGIYPLEPSIKLGEAANVAGGPTNDSKRNQVELVRGASRHTYDLRADPDKANMALASGDQIYVPQKSWLSRNSTWFISTLVAVGGTVAILVTR
jgi:polysaccharide export outer membrane protein